MSVFGAQFWAVKSGGRRKACQPTAGGAMRSEHRRIGHRQTLTDPEGVAPGCRNWSHSNKGLFFALDPMNVVRLYLPEVLPVAPPNPGPGSAGGVGDIVGSPRTARC
jgi:hypothetical protein